jgi:hypothetical protein
MEGNEASRRKELEVSHRRAPDPGAMLPAPSVTGQIDCAPFVEADALGLQHRALETRVLAVRGDASSSVDDTLPGDRSVRSRTDRPTHTDGCEAAIDELG